MILTVFQSVYIKKKTNSHLIFCYLLLFLKFSGIPYYIPFLYFPHFLTFHFFVNTVVGVQFRRLSFIGCYS